MPELPEVETVVKTLQHQLGHPVISQAEVFWDNIIAFPDPASFCRLIANQEIVDYQRRGKFLIFRLSRATLIVHLRMEGKFFVYAGPTPKDKHTHVIFTLQDGRQLHYNDTRKFGRMWLYSAGQPLAALDSLGCEPWDELLTGAYLHRFAGKYHLPVKTMLLQQEMIAGIGNIYADEICFRARLYPLTPACFISAEKWDEVIKQTRLILKQAIDQGGTTIRSYTSSLGVTGRFQQYLQVHSREGQPCYQCQTLIIRQFVNGRSTYWCPVCQPRKPVVIAVSGSIGSGKSEVMAELGRQNCLTVSCDEINRQLLSEPAVKKQLAAILNCRPVQIDKERLTGAIYSNPAVKKQVETCLHALIMKEIKGWIAANQKEMILAVEVPLLFEAGWDYYFDYNVVVSATPKAAAGRLSENRHLDAAMIEKITASQWPVGAKEEKADCVITNNGSLAQLQQKTAKLLSRIRTIIGKEGN